MSEPVSTSKGSDRPAGGDQPAGGGAPARPRRQPRPAPPAPRRLVDTPGPDPATPLAETRLVVGRVIGTHGLQGHLKVVVLTDDPEYLATRKRLWLGDEPRPRKVLDVRFHQGQALIRLSGIGDPETAGAFRGHLLRIPGAEARPLAPGEFRIYQLVGLEAVTEDGAPLGRVTDILETGANDVFVVTPPAGEEILLPYHPEVILDISPESGRMVVRPMRYFGEDEEDGTPAPPRADRTKRRGRRPVHRRGTSPAGDTAADSGGEG